MTGATITAQTFLRPLVIATAVVLALTGCAGTARPIPSPHARTQSATPTPSVDAASGPAVVRPPSSESEAIADANRSLVGYYNASFTSGHAGGARLDLVTPWATGPTLENEGILADYLKQKHYRLDGTPTRWSLNEGRSTAAPTTAASGGATTAFGSVQLVGCIESTNRPVGAGAPAWTTQGKRTSIQWSVLYDAAQRQWLVNASSPVTAKNGPISCG